MLRRQNIRNSENSDGSVSDKRNIHGYSLYKNSSTKSFYMKTVVPTRVIDLVQFSVMYFVVKGCYNPSVGIPKADLTFTFAQSFGKMPWMVGTSGIWTSVPDTPSGPKSHRWPTS